MGRINHISSECVVLPRGARASVLTAIATMAIVGIALLGFVGSSRVAAQEQDEEPESHAPGHLLGLDEWADSVIEMTSGRWEGRRVSGAAPTSRPSSDYRIDSPLLPLSVHANAAVPIERAVAVLEELERVVAWMEREGWASALADGGHGETDGFDLYLQPTDALADAFADGRAHWSFLDAASSYAVVDPDVAAADLRSCVASAYGQAIAINLDPAEAENWRRATGAWLSWRWTGQFGCADALGQQQHDSWRSWIATGAGAGEGGALFLEMLSQRLDGGSGAAVRHLWDFARQRTWEGLDYRAAPDLWQVVDRAVELDGGKLHSVVEDFAVSRWWLGARDGKSAWLALKGLGEDATIAPLFEASIDAMPVHTGASMSLDPFGSAYALVDVRGAPPASRLRVWLRGEYGVEWALTGSRLDESGREMARLSAPPRRGDRRSYLPVELTPDTTHVMVSVTNLSHRLPDADDPDVNGRAFRLIFDLVND